MRTTIYLSILFLSFLVLGFAEQGVAQEELGLPLRGDSPAIRSEVNGQHLPIRNPVPITEDCVGNWEVISTQVVIDGEVYDPVFAFGTTFLSITDSTWTLSLDIPPFILPPLGYACSATGPIDFETSGTGITTAVSDSSCDDAPVEIPLANNAEGSCFLYESGLHRITLTYEVDGVPHVAVIESNEAP